MGDAFDLPTQITIGNHNASDCHLNHAGFIWVSLITLLLLISTVCLFFPFIPSRSSKRWQNWLKKENQSPWERSRLASSPGTRHKRPAVWSRAGS